MDQNQKPEKIILFAILAYGITSITFQILLIREMLIVFSGNELSIGIAISNWVLFGAVGSYIASRLAYRVSVQIFIFLQIIVSLILLGVVYEVRIIRDLVGVNTGIVMGLLPTLFLSLLVLVPVTLLGCTFVFGCKIYHQITSENRSVGKVYAYEAIGCGLGGIMLTLLITHLNSIQIAFLLLILNTFSAFLLLSIFQPKLRIKLIFALIFITILLISTPLPDVLHSKSMKLQWSGQKVLFYKNSIYSNVVVTQKDEQLTVFVDGYQFLSSPDSELFMEEVVNIPLLLHPSQKKSLLLAGQIF